MKTKQLYFQVPSCIWRVGNIQLTVYRRESKKDRQTTFQKAIRVGMYLGLLAWFGLPSAWAQSTIPVLPAPEPPEPQPLPPTEAPLERPKPPPPEPTRDVPGTVTVRKFEIVGSTIFSQAELQQATADFVNRPLTFAQLLQAAARVTQLYLEEGYITSGAYIPSQELRSGELTIQVVEGRLEEINVNIVNERLNPNYVRDRLELATTGPLNINRLQEALQLLQLNPLIESLNAELTAGTRAGNNILDVTVNGAETFNVQLRLDNSRNPSVGSFQRRIEVSEANLLGWGDGASLAYSNTEGSDLFEARYALPLNARNGTLNVDYTTIDSKIVETFEELNIELDIRDWNVTYRQPVIQRATPDVTQELALSLTAARRYSDSQIDGEDIQLFIGADEEGKTRISALRFAQEWTERGRQQVLAARSQFSLGVDAFDATVNREGPDSRFLAWRGQLLYLRLLNRPVDNAIGPTLLLRSDVQLATASLLSLEQFSLGGQETVRGYRQNAILSDNGILASAEARLPILRVSSLDGTLQVAPFVDFGFAWNTDRNNPDPNTLFGVGLGLLWQMGEDFSARVDVGIPVVDIDNLGEDRTWQENGVYFQLEYNLNPF